MAYQYQYPPKCVLLFYGWSVLYCAPLIIFLYIFCHIYVHLYGRSYGLSFDCDHKQSTTFGWPAANGETQNEFNFNFKAANDWFYI